MQYKGAVTEMVTKDADVLPPESMVEAEADNYLNDLAFQMRQQGIPLEKYLSSPMDSMVMSKQNAAPEQKLSLNKDWSWKLLLKKKASM